MASRSTPQPLGTPHPAKALLAAEGQTITYAARAIGVSPHTLQVVLSGNKPASARVRSALARHLGRPEAELFHGVVERAPERDLAAERAAQGLPPTISNAEALARIAEILVVAGRRRQSA